MSDCGPDSSPGAGRPTKRRRTRSPSPLTAVALAEAKLAAHDGAHAMDDEGEFEFDEDDDSYGQYDDDDDTSNQSMGECAGAIVDAVNGEEDDEDNLAFEDISLPSLNHVGAPAGSYHPNNGDGGGGDDDDDDDDEGLEFEDVAIPSTDPQQPSTWSSSVPIPIPTNLSTIEFTLPLNPSDSQSSASQKKRRAITKSDRITRLTLHRMHLLSLLAAAHLGHRAAYCDETVQALVRSLIPPTVATPMRLGSDHVRLGPLVTWLRSEFTADPMLPWPDGAEAIAEAISNRVGHPCTLVLAVASLLWHVVGVKARLVAGLNPIALTFQGESVVSAPGSNTAPSSSAKPSREVLVEKAATVYPIAFALEVPKGHGEWTPLYFNWTVIDRMTPTTSSSHTRGSYTSRSASSSSECQSHPFDALKSSGGPHFASPYVLALTHPPRRHLSFIPRAKDVSVRYLTGRRGGRPVEDPKYRVPLDDAWWSRVVATAAGDSAAVAHAVEDQFMLEQLLVNAPFPTRLADYKDHRVYALERHLRKDEVIHPQEPVLGKIKGELIYPRANVKQVKSERVWVRQFGRQVKEGERPVKESKVRGKSRGGQGDDDSQASECGAVGLFGEWQTEPYESTAKVDPVTGEVPTNDHGNVELFHPCMVPRGGVHVTGTPYFLIVCCRFHGPGVAHRHAEIARTVPNAKRIAKDLAIPFAEAMVGFDFTAGGRTRPSIHGIVVAAHAGPIIQEAATNLAAAQQEQELASHKQRVAMRWVMFAKGLVAREQVQRLFVRTGARPVASASNGLQNGVASDESNSTDDEADKLGPRLRRRRVLRGTAGRDCQGSFDSDSSSGSGSGSGDDDVEHPAADGLTLTSESESQTDTRRSSMGSSECESEEEWDDDLDLGPRARRRRPERHSQSSAGTPEACLPPSFDEGGGGFM